MGVLGQQTFPSTAADTP